MSATQLVLFDFDGTLCNSFLTVIQCMNQLPPEWGLRKIAEGDYPKIKNLTVKQLLKEAGLPLYRLPQLVIRVRSDLNQHMKSMPGFPGVKELCTELHSRGIKIGILSSNSEENVLSFLKQHEMNFFDFVHTGSTLFGKDKRIVKILKKHQISVENALYVGDEIRDIEACRKTGLKVAAVTWGFNSKEALAAAQPDYLIDQASELVTLLSQS